MLGFKVAVNGSLTRYNLVDQSIDEFYDTSGVDASASTNENRVASGSNFYYSGSVAGAPTGADSSDTSVAGYTTLVCSSATGSLVVPSAANVTMLVVGGGGSGGCDYGGGGGAGGLIYKATHAVTAQTYDWVRGAGAAGQTSGETRGNNGADSTFTINGGATEFTAKGGGAGGAETDTAGQDGGSGGGDGNGSGITGGNETQTGQAGDSGTYGFGNDGGKPSEDSNHNVGGGGGAGSAGGAGVVLKSGDGGTGKDYSTIFGTAVGASGWFASGGGGGWTSNGNSQAGTASAGGGSNGGTPLNGASSAATALTGGGSGGGAETNGASGNGGTGIILMRYADGAFTSYNDMTLQSTDVTAEAEPDFGEFVTLMEDAAGTATLNTDIKGYISRDSGVTFTQGTLVDEGTWGTNKKILGFHDLDISSQPSGTSMCYKITTHNQSVSKQTGVYATSIGWR